ncbi:5-formyltetrahydrofolate cyclo-ligase [Methylonatrum kenyense]|uniref:5-formyltetrahydrofolate cyclo-ligase n=1 Tax=Methylonatrum kenyense TaxID=455253 RepID=UPI0020BE9504|nr:5-formyltetrahydrofolate cyclo-ligase [Methylonatrum kenyense]MCK8516586.1 5-formyltetrahydrofolate cyclo-ligase [Methylonatrum kenyense]
MSPDTDRSAIRRAMRQQRAQLSAAARNALSAKLCHTISRLLPWQKARRLALFLPHRGEPDLRPLLAEGRRQGKRIVVPVLKPFGERGLWFREITAETRLRPNRFGIGEPGARAARLKPRELDLVLTPLLAFDGAGNRLGMGAGFYDRSFAFLQRQQGWRRPLLLGVGFGFQEVPQLPAQAWDVPLHGVITELDLRRFR